MVDHDYKSGGWKNKYVIEKTDGTPLDSQAVYFVLRLDEDPHARVAALAYAESVASVNPQFSADIKTKLAKFPSI